jgi:PAS domain S-box-containing protein
MKRMFPQSSRTFYLAPIVASLVGLLLLGVFLQELTRERRAWEGAWEARAEVTRQVNRLFGRFTATHVALFSALVNDDGTAEATQLAEVRELTVDVLTLGRTLHWPGAEGAWFGLSRALEAYGAAAAEMVARKGTEGAVVDAFGVVQRTFIATRARMEDDLLAEARETAARGDRQSTVAWGVGLTLLVVLFLLAHWAAQDVSGSLAAVATRLRRLGDQARADLGQDAPVGQGGQESSDPFARLRAATDAFERVLGELRESRNVLSTHRRSLARESEGRAVAEAAFGASEHRFRTLVNHAPMAIYVHRHFHILYANPALMTLIGASPDAVPTDSGTFIVPEERETVRRLHEARLRGESAPADYEMEILGRDGARRLALTRSFRIDWEDGPAICTTLLDLTERRDALNQARVASAALDQTPNMFFITDPKGRILYVNPAFTQQTGYTADEAVGRTPAILRHPSTTRETHADLWATIQSGREWRAEIVDQRKDGSAFWAFISISPVRDDAGAITHYVAMHQDISDRKTAEANLRRAKEEAEVANRAKSEFLANMSHELRTPLNAIIGFSESMLAQFLGPLDPKYVEYTKDIRDSGAHLLSLINDILDVSAIEAGRLVPREEVIHTGELLATVDRLIRPRAEGAKLTLITEVGEGVPDLWCDPRRVKQILLNLLSNAVKFTEGGGEVWMRAFVADGGKVVLEVSDTGIGMSRQDVETALTPFGQVDSGLARRQTGSGLGLPLTRGLAELHGADFHLDSAAGRGTRIRVTFPAERSRAPRSMGNA